MAIENMWGHFRCINEGMKELCQQFTGCTKDCDRKGSNDRRGIECESTKMVGR